MSHAGDFYIALMLCASPKFPLTIFDRVNFVMKYNLHGSNDSASTTMKTRMHTESLIALLQVFNKRPDIWKFHYTFRIIYKIWRANYYAMQDFEDRTLVSLNANIMQINFFPLNMEIFKKVLILRARWFYFLEKILRVFVIIYWKLQVFQSKYLKKIS
jgi:hypothetical protein